METIRTPYQGISNIIRFNWHFYVIAFGTASSLFVASYLLQHHLLFYLLAGAITCTTIISLWASYYIYDVSSLYQLDWLNSDKTDALILNINAGFDETSRLIEEQYPQATVLALDFYDPQKHTEVSIKRAREAYPPFLGTQKIDTHQLGMEDNSVDKIILMLAAHEIRNEEERIRFFQELKRVLKPSGRIYVTEHLRDTANFMAYTIGFLHFHSKKTWFTTFRKAGLALNTELKTTPFISTFILHKYGSAS